MGYLKTQIRVTSLLIWLLYCATLAAVPWVLFGDTQPSDMLPVLVGHVFCALAVIAHRRGADWVRHPLLVAIAATIGFLSPEQFIADEFSISLFIVPTLALVLTNGWWVIGASLLTYGTLLARAGFRGIYTEPMALVISSIIVGGIALARFLVDAAIRRAEEQAALLEEHARLLRAERSSLALRVEERTRELSEANAALVRAGEAKNNFLANISHELRTPLNIILGNVELVAEGIYGPVSEQQRRSLNRVTTSGQHLLELINDILDLARMERGTFTVERGPVDLRRLCAGLVELVGPTAERKGLRLEYAVTPALPLASLDERRIRQILLNLLSNAVKFTPAGGVVSLAIEPDETAGWVRFVVLDSGIGIAPEEQRLLFNPFVQLDAGLDRNHEGVGLGLALVAQLTRLHGGSVSVTSARGAGSRFTVRIPLEPAAVVPTPDLTYGI